MGEFLVSLHMRMDSNTISAYSTTHNGRQGDYSCPLDPSSVTFFSHRVFPVNILQVRVPPQTFHSCEPVHHANSPSTAMHRSVSLILLLYSLGGILTVPSYGVSLQRFCFQYIIDMLSIVDLLL